MTDVNGLTALDNVLSGDERYALFTAAVSRLNGPAPRPVFSKVKDGELDDIFRFGPEARLGVRSGTLHIIDPAGQKIAAWPACPRGCWPMDPQFIDLDGDGVADLSAMAKDYTDAADAVPECRHNVARCPRVVPFTLLLGLRGGQTRLMLNYDAARDRLTGNQPIPASLRGVISAELDRRGNLDPPHSERLLSSYALMADGQWMFELSMRHREALELDKNHQPAKAAAHLEALLGADAVDKKDPSRDPDVTIYLNDLGFFLSEAGLNDRAVPVLRRVVARAPDRAVAYLNLADAEYTLGDAGTARGHYQQYVTLMERAGHAGKAPGRVADRLAGR